MAESSNDLSVRSVNYSQYLGRMTAAVNRSGKGLIPYFAAMLAPDFTPFSVLDYGCGSGVLMQAMHDLIPNASIYGIDANPHAVDHCRAQGFDVDWGEIDAIGSGGRKFSCIVFSSVLHEISSYDPDEPYGVRPIRDALTRAAAALEPNGFLIIRDGVRSSLIGSVTFRFQDDADIRWVDRFAAEYKAQQVVFSHNHDGTVTMEAGLAKEFLHTFTWGPDSWPREVREQFGILRIDEWHDLFHSLGLHIAVQMISAEEYLKYLGEKVEITDEIAALFEEATALFVVRKVRN